MTNKHILFFAILILLASSCKKDGPTDPDGNTVITPGNNGVYIINEGNFQFGNASVSYYADGMDEAVLDLFQPANNRPLGDVCQSIYVFNNKAFIVVNNSGKIEVVNPNSFVSTATITGFNSPRYILPINNSKAYVTDLYSDAISIVSLSSYSVTGTIPCSGWTEELLLIYGEVFVANKEKDKLYIINAQNDVVTDSIGIGYGANSMVEDKNGKIWVLCGGNQNTIPATLHRINPLNHTIESTYTFANTADSPWRLDINGSNDTLYFLNNHCYRMSINDNNLPASAFIPSNGRNFYGIGINSNNSNVYLGDAIDYVQRGRIYIYKPDGNLADEFLAGIIPSDFYFKN